MRIERTFTTAESPDSARVKLASYLEQAGYKTAGAGPVLAYQRGSAWGSVTGSPPQAAQSRVAVEVRTGYDQKTWVCAIAAIDLGAFAKKDPTFWQQEMDGLVASAGGVVADMGSAAVQSLAPAFGVRQAGLRAAGTAADSRVRAGASWLFMIAGLSIINIVVFRLGLNISFLIGLSGTVLIEGIAMAVAERLPGSATLVLVIAMVVEVLVAGIFVVLGLLARKKLRWAFILAMVFYALDGIIWLVFGEYLPAGFHLLGLYGIYNGLRALGQRRTDSPAT